MQERLEQLTVSDPPEVTVVGSALGNVAWRQWCIEEERRIRRHGRLAAVRLVNEREIAVFVEPMCRSSYA